ncbi:MAG: hypothetical protein IT210_17910 [Armatimonadetes bacterium]|nr:hypothetical protein [Armatimonadota bacterium]
MKSAVDIGSRIEMLVDEWLVESKKDAHLRLNPPVRREIVLVADKPWEGKDSAYYTALRDGSKIRLYYRGFCPTDDSEGQVTCLAESEDGVRFTRPNLGLFDFDGSKENNIVYRGSESHNFAPFVDTNPKAKPEERYKALAGISGGLYAFGSPDGVHWKKMRPETVQTEGAFDSLNVGFWDAVAGRYRSYSRYWHAWKEGGCRAIQSSVSEDFLRWSDPQPNLYGEGVPYEHFYTNATWPCPGAPHILLSFPKRFVPERTKLTKEPGVSDAVFMSSRDGVHWDRAFMEAWVRPGPDERNWTQRSNMTAWGIVQTAPDEFSLYISEHYDWPDNRLRRLTVRRHGFASMNADGAGGEFTTRPLTFSGKRLILNYATSAVGSVRVEIQDEQREPIPGYTLEEAVPLFGDELDAPYRWKSGDDIASLAGRPVRFRFVLKDADIYALRAGE